CRATQFGHRLISRKRIVIELRRSHAEGGSGLMRRAALIRVLLAAAIVLASIDATYAQRGCRQIEQESRCRTTEQPPRTQPSDSGKAVGASTVGAVVTAIIAALIQSQLSPNQGSSSQSSPPGSQPPPSPPAGAVPAPGAAPALPALRSGCSVPPVG